jgi:uncharacterized membrane protein YgcG
LVWMLRALLIVAALLPSVCVAAAEQSDHGPAYLATSQRGPNFPKYVAPNESNPANWIAAPPLPEPVPTTRWWARWGPRWRLAHGFRGARGFGAGLGFGGARGGGAHGGGGARGGRR